jgi:hypothetical protein
MVRVMSLIINYKRNMEIKKKYPERGDMEIWLMTHSWKIRNLNAKLDGKPLAELIRLDERLIVAIDGENKKMNILNDIKFTDF